MKYPTAPSRINTAMNSWNKAASPSEMFELPHSSQLPKAASSDPCVTHDAIAAKRSHRLEVTALNLQPLVGRWPVG